MGRDFSAIASLPEPTVRVLGRLVASAIAALEQIDPAGEGDVARASIEQDEGFWLLTIEVPEGGA
jgi:hypothetical protein